jgi:hypothetical protein
MTWEKREKANKALALILAIVLHIGIFASIYYFNSSPASDQTEVEVEKGKKQKVAELSKGKS